MIVKNAVVVSNKRPVVYKGMYWKLRPKKRYRVNEKAIFGVIQLSNEGARKGKICAVAPPGTSTFLEGRLQQLIRDTKNYDFTKAAQRFRVAIKGWRDERKAFYLDTGKTAMLTAPIRHPRWAPTRSAYKPPRRQTYLYIPDIAEDLLAIPPSLDRKAEVPLDDPIRMCRKPVAKAA